MSRSLKKGPFIDPKLEAKVVAQAEGNKKSVIKNLVACKYDLA